MWCREKEREKKNRREKEKRENGSGRRAVDFDSAARRRRRRRRRRREEEEQATVCVRRFHFLFCFSRRERNHFILICRLELLVLWKEEVKEKKSMKCVRHQLRASTSSHGASPSLLRRRRTCRLSQQSQQQRLCRTRAAEEPEQKTAIPDAEDAVFDENVNAFCSLDEQGKAIKKKKSLGEMEQEYLDALRSFYMNESPSMSDEEFDVLKDELLWEGSTVVTMTKEEQMFLEATKAYSMGKPIMSDAEFNDLKMKLKDQGSPIASGGPRCSIRSRRVYTDLNVDYLRLTLLNIPGVGVALAGLFVLDFLTGFKISAFVELPEPIGFVAVWLVVLPILYIVSDSLTKIVLKDALVLKGQCTQCGDDQVLFFGKVLGVEGNDPVSDIMCASCKCKMTADSRKRELTEIPAKKKPAKKKPAKAKA